MDISRTVIGRIASDPYEIHYGYELTQGMFVRAYRIDSDGHPEYDEPVYDENERLTGLGVARAMWLFSLFCLSVQEAGYYLRLQTAYTRKDNRKRDRSFYKVQVTEPRCRTCNVALTWRNRSRRYNHACLACEIAEMRDE